MHPWHNVDPGEDFPDRINVIVEIPKGSRNKYELNKESGVFQLDRVLYSPMVYPGDYGFIPKSYYDDGDPLDVLILTNEPTFTGCLIEARPVGIFKMLDKGAADDKILCVPSQSPFFGNIYDLQDVPPHFLMEVAHFFAVYKDLEGSRTLSLGWEAASEAKKAIVHGLDLYENEVKPSIDRSDEAKKRINAAKKTAKKVRGASTVKAAKKASVKAAKKAAPKKIAAKKPAKKAR